MSPYLFTGGDVATGPSLVVDAIGGGRRAARSIHQYITGEAVKSSPKSLRKQHIPESIFVTVPGVGKSKRTPMPELPVKARIDSMIEVDQVISEADAKHEANRCLDCCRVCYNPDVVLRIDQTSANDGNQKDQKRSLTGESIQKKRCRRDSWRQRFFYSILEAERKPCGCILFLNWLINSAMSVGKGASKINRSPFTGWLIRSFQACKLLPI